MQSTSYSLAYANESSIYKYVYAVRRSRNPDTDVYYAKESDTHFAHDCNKTEVVIVRCMKGDSTYREALFNSFLAETNKSYSFDCDAFTTWCRINGF